MSFVDEGYSLITPNIFEGGARKVPEMPGVYALLMKGADRVLDLAGYGAGKRCAPWHVGDYVHLYTGESFNLAGRITDHLFGEPAASGFQLTLLALQHAHQSLWMSGSDEPDFVVVNRLRSLLRDNALIAFKQTPLCGDAEEDLIRRSGSPLNIRGRPQDDFTRVLTRVRQSLRQSGFQRLFEAQKTSRGARHVAQSDLGSLARLEPA